MTTLLKNLKKNISEKLGYFACSSSREQDNNVTHNLLVIRI